MVGRRGWGAAFALGMLWQTCVATAAVRELRGITLRRVQGGARVELELSRAGIPRFAVVRDERGVLERLQIDLPVGTVVASALVRSTPSTPPVANLRVGLLEDGTPRVVLELRGATDYRLEDGGPPGTVTVTVLGDTGPGGVVGPPSAPVGRAQNMRPPRPKRARPRVVLDPGHGGDDPGAQGYATEKAITLDIALRLAGLLRRRLGAEVVLTRTADETLALKDRTTRANAENADLFVSIHANANPTGDLKGIETYYLDNSTDRGTLRLAEMENGLDLLNASGKESSLRYILSDMVQGGKIEDSARLARHLQRGLVGHMRRHYTGVVDLGVKRGPFYVLVGAYMPCVLVETAFLTHAVEGRRLATEAYRDQVAQGLYTGITRYLSDGARRRTL